MTQHELYKRTADEVMKGDNMDQKIQVLQVDSLQGLKDAIVALCSTFESYTIRQDTLSNRILWLNIVLGLLTAAGFVAGIITVIKALSKQG